MMPTAPNHKIYVGNCVQFQSIFRTNVHLLYRIFTGYVAYSHLSQCFPCQECDHSSKSAPKRFTRAFLFPQQKNDTTCKLRYIACTTPMSSWACIPSLISSPVPGSSDLKLICVLINPKQNIQPELHTSGSYLAFGPV